MSESLEVTWQVQDGYAGVSRPQFLRLSAEDFEFCGDVEEAMVFVYKDLDDALSELGYYFDEDAVREWLSGVVGK